MYHLRFEIIITAKNYRIFLKEIIPKVYFFYFNRNVENYVESVNVNVDTVRILQENYRVLKNP